MKSGVPQCQLRQERDGGKAGRIRAVLRQGSHEYLHSARYSHRRIYERGPEVSGAGLINSFPEPHAPEATHGGTAVEREGAYRLTASSPAYPVD